MKYHPDPFLLVLVWDALVLYGAALLLLCFQSKTALIAISILMALSFLISLVAFILILIDAANERNS